MPVQDRTGRSPQLFSVSGVAHARPGSNLSGDRPPSQLFSVSDAAHARPGSNVPRKILRSRRKASPTEGPDGKFPVSVGPYARPWYEQVPRR